MKDKVEGADFVFFTEVFIQGSAHDGSADAGGCGEVGFARFAPRRIDTLRDSLLVYGKQPRTERHTCVNFCHFRGSDVVVDEGFRMFTFKMQG